MLRKILCIKMIILYTRCMHKKGGFTIVELVIVIAVIAILATISIVSYNGIIGRSHDAAVVSDLGKVKDALAIYESKNSVYSWDSIAEVIDYLKNDSSIQVTFTSGSYARPDIYQNYSDNTIMVGYMRTGICMIAKSRSGQNYVFTTAGTIAKTSKITTMGDGHDFRDACGVEGRLPNAESLVYGPIGI